MNPPPTWHIYLLRCSDGTIYTGCTGNLIQRKAAHKNGEVKYTQTRLPFQLVTYITFHEKYKAYFFEKYLKSGSGKAFMNKRLI